MKKNINYLKVASNIYLKKKTPVSLIHFLTNRCNARCSFCFIDFENPDTFKNELSLNEIEKMTKTLGDTLINVNFTGGEPFARKDILDDINSQLKDAIDKGAKLCYQMKNIPKHGYFFAPSIVENIDSSMDIYHNETFGPLFTILTYTDEQEAIKIANDTKYGLGGSIWTKNTKNAEKMAHQIYTGAVFINEFTKSDPRMPFGGVGISGFGRELGSYGIKEFVNVKIIYIN